MIDEGNREGLEIAMGVSLPSRRVVRVLNELVAIHGRLSAVGVDNGPEFTAQPFVEWCAEHCVTTHDIQSGKPGQNAYIERFNRSYRTDVLTRTSLNPSRSCASSPTRGSGSTTLSGPTIASGGCRH